MLTNISMSGVLVEKVTTKLKREQTNLLQRACARRAKQIKRCYSSKRKKNSENMAFKRLIGSWRQKDSRNELQLSAENTSS